MNNSEKKGPAVIIIEDTAIASLSIQAWIKPTEFHIIGPITNKEEAIKTINREKDEIALAILDLKILEFPSDLNSEFEHGLEVAELLNEVSIPVLVFSNYIFPEILEKTLKHGYSFFYKEDDPGEADLRQAVELTTRGYVVYSRKVLSEINRLLESKNNIDPLGEKEWKLLAHRVNGLSIKEVAEKESYAYQTVRTYISIIYKKIGVSNQIEAYRWFQDNGKKFGKEELLHLEDNN